MTGATCAELAEIRSAYIDGALGDADRELLLQHLVDCADCRNEIAETRFIRSLIKPARDPAAAPPDLSQRLVSIAGSEARDPLWEQPFRPPHDQQLTGKLRRRSLGRSRSRLVTAVVGCWIALLVVAGVGYVSAPQTAALPQIDPTDRAIQEFTTLVSSFPLDARVSAALQGRQLVDGQSGGTPTPIRLPATGFAEAKSVIRLRQAGLAGDELSYAGTQRIVLDRAGQQLTGSLSVDNLGGVGTELGTAGEVVGATPGSVSETFVAADSSSRIADADLIERLSQQLELRGWKDQTYAGRPAEVIEGIAPGASPAGGELAGVLARWWVDEQTKLLLGQELYDGVGHRLVSSTLTRLRFESPVADKSDHSGQGGSGSATDPTSLPKVVGAANTTLTLSHTASLQRDGWICPEQLAGLRLLRLRADRAQDPQLVQLVYSDGLSTLVVIEQRGVLPEKLSGVARNETLNAWVSDGLPVAATWSSNDLVLTAVTDGSRETLAATVAALPHQPLQRPSVAQRIKAGWARILGR